MANTVTIAKSKHLTLASTAVDTVTFSGNYGWVEVVNKATSGNGITFTTDGTTAPTDRGDDMEWVGPGESVIAPLTGTGANDVVKLIGSGESYFIRGVNG